MIDRTKWIGYRTPAVGVPVERGQLAFFAKATGETNPIYFDESAAIAAGHPALPAPPTFAFSLSSMARALGGADGNYAAKMGINIGHVLHGEQAFEYHKPIYAGDVLTLSSAVTDIYEKKGGAMEFVILTTDGLNQNGELCVRLQNTVVVRNPAPSQ